MLARPVLASSFLFFYFFLMAIDDDGEWEFLRTPPKTKIPKPDEKVHFKVVFGGSTTEYELAVDDTFESIYADYENKFKIALGLEYNSVSLSKYAKARVLQGKPSPQTLRIVRIEEPLISEKTTYRIRHSSYECIEIERENEITVEDLLNTIKKKLPPPSASCEEYLDFEGDILEPAQKLDEVLQSGDLLDLIRTQK